MLREREQAITLGPVPRPVLRFRAASRTVAATLAFARHKPLAAFGGGVLAVFVAMALAAPIIAPYSPSAMLRGEALLAPSLAHPFGTDNFGRDMLSRVFFGARISLYVGLGVVMLSSLVGAIIGIVSGYAGGSFDIVMQRVVDAVMAFPGLVLALSVMTILGMGINNVIVALSIRQAASNSRTVRSAVLAVKENQFIEAARASGCGPVRIMWVHILPNVLAPMIVLASLALGTAILSESALSFLGFGVPPPEPSWGGMLSGEGRNYMARAPWMALFPGVALSLAVFSINVFGDGLRDVLDPRMRGARA